MNDERDKKSPWTKEYRLLGIELIVDREIQLPAHPDDVKEFEALANELGEKRPAVVGESIRRGLAILAVTSEARGRRLLEEEKRAFNRLDSDVESYPTVRSSMSPGEKMVMKEVAKAYKVSNLVLLRFCRKVYRKELVELGRIAD